MNNRPLVFYQFFYSTYRFTLDSAFYTYIISWPVENCVCIFVDKIEKQLKILWLSTFINKLNLLIDNYQQKINIEYYRLINYIF